jgi:hypothetical protein
MNADRSSTPDVSGTTSQPTEWEAAYLRFETPEQEVRKFRNRLPRLGSSRWPRDAKVVELFCGRGSGLLALRTLGFEDIEGIDLFGAQPDGGKHRPGVLPEERRVPHMELFGSR